MKNVSVIIPSFNRANKIQRAIESVLDQTYKDFELIVVDDASTDETPEVVNRFNDERIRYHRNDSNLGGAASRNVGIKISKNDFIAFLDDDDEWLPTKLEKQVNMLKEADSSYCGVYTGLEKILDGQVISKKISRKEGELFDDLLRENIIGSTSVVLLKKGHVIEVGSFTEGLPASQELELYLRLAKKYKFKCIPEPLVRYYVHKGDQITSDYSKKLKAKRYLFKKYEEKIKSDQDLHARYLYEMSYYEYKNGNKKQYKNHFKEAFFLSPLGIKYLIRNALSKLILGL